jgi:hypothetical protein
MGEDIEFSAQLYDETYVPVSDANISISISNRNNKFDIPLYHSGNGIYEGKFQTQFYGDFDFIATAFHNSDHLEKSSGKFSIKQVDPEKENLTMDRNLLQLIASSAGGEYIELKDLENLFTKINRYNVNNKSEKVEQSTLEIWTDERFLLLLIILFSIEWFIRKRSGML